MPADKLKSIFEEPGLSVEEAAKLVNQLDHFKIARLLHSLPTEEKLKIFQYLDSDKKRQEVLYETDYDSRQEIMEALGPEATGSLLETMPVDEATDIIQEHAPEDREEILNTLGTKEAQIIKDLIQYREETAGGMMNPEFYRVPQDMLAGDLLMKLIREPNHDHGHYFFVVDEEGHLLGYFKMRDLLHAPSNFKAVQLVREKTPKVSLNDSCEVVASIMDQEHMSTLPVVDENNIIRGIVTFDDVLRVIQDEASEDIFTMVGTAKVDPFAKKILGKVRARVPWLLTTFVGGLISAFVLHQFKWRLSEFATVIFFLPFVLGLAGNVGIQGATVIVRGMATGDIQEDNLSRIVISEVSVGLINGLLFGLLCGVIITLIASPILHSRPLLGLSVGLGIFLAVATASLVGSLAPWGFSKLHIDPAISTGPMVTVMNDILGLVIYMTTTYFIFSLLG